MLDAVGHHHQRRQHEIRAIAAVSQRDEGDVGRSSLGHGIGRTCRARILRISSVLQAAVPLTRMPDPYHEAARTLAPRSEEHTSELQSLMRISYAVFCLKKKTHTKQ